MMKHDTSNTRDAGGQGGANDQHETAPATRSNAQAGGSTSASSRNWAWAHQSDSYDWMDSYTGLPATELSDSDDTGRTEE
jgi:hypothetical protein